MINVYFQLDKPKEMESWITLVAYFAKQRCKTSTKLKVQTKYWSQDAQSVKRSVNYPDGKRINEELKKQQDIIEVIYQKITNAYNRQPDTKELIHAFRQEYFENSPYFTTIDIPAKVTT